MNVSPNEGGDVIVDGARQTEATKSYSCSLGNSVSLSADPASEYKFDRWGGALSGNASPTSITMNASKTVTAYFKEKAADLTPTQAKAKIDSDTDMIIIDVRTVAEFESADSHILCAFNRPFNSGTMNASDFDVNDDILLYDSNNTGDARAENAADYLVAQGFENLSIMTGGLDAWKAQGWETVSTCGECAGNCSNPGMANAGPDQTVGENQTVTLNGSNSQHPTGGNLNYQWVQIGGDPQVSLANANTARPQFTSPYVQGEDAVLVFKLTVTDDAGKKDMDSVRVIVDFFNDPPVADAGVDLTIGPGQAIVINGAGSYDQEGAVSCNWMVTSGNLGSGFSLSDNTSMRPVFRAPATIPSSTSFAELTLMATDGGGKMARDTVKITVDQNIDCIPAQVYGNADLFIPMLRFNYGPGAGDYYLLWVRMEFAGNDSSGRLQWRVKEFNFNDAAYSTGDCAIATLSDTLQLNLPNVQFKMPAEPLALSATLQYTGQDPSTGELLFSLTSAVVK